MRTIYCYATEETLPLLEDSTEKALLIGSDFGYGNFGDILQLKGAIDVINQTGRYNPVTVFAADAIRNRSFPNDILGYYGSKMFIFISESPIKLDPVNDPKLVPISIINNVSLLYLYGGGFLNQYWGNYVLNIIEFFLSKNEKITYIVSGQQVTAPFDSNFAEHVNRFRPSLVGVRDRKSGEFLASQGVDNIFSFDDATEEMFKFAAKVKLQQGDGLFLHLNSSSYTANPDLTRRKILAEIGQDLELIRPLVKRTDQVNLLQAFIDAKDDVCDTLETIKGLETGFPFPITNQVLLTLLCDENNSDKVLDSLSGRFGYSCSYHVALWLRLAGIPCWLRGANEFYKQKSEGLGISQTLPQFLEKPNLPDFSAELDQRNQWLEKFRQHLLEIPQGNGHALHFDNTDADLNARTFNYKGYPTKAQLLVELNSDNEKNKSWIAERERTIESLQQEKDSLVITYQGEIEKLNMENSVLLKESTRRLFELESENQRISARITEKDRTIETLKQENDSLVITYQSEIEKLNLENSVLAEGNTHLLSLESIAEERISALTELVTSHGSKIHELLQSNDTIRKENDRLHVDLYQYQQSAQHYKDEIEKLFRTRSWRLTKPLRAIARFVRHGYFDSHGQIRLGDLWRIFLNKLKKLTASKE